MAAYRLNYLSRTQKTVRSRDLTCNSDDEAIDRAALCSHAGALELWRQDQMVWRFEPRAAERLAEARALAARRR
jgi:hypothetical protein